MLFSLVPIGTGNPGEENGQVIERHEKVPERAGDSEPDQAHCSSSTCQPDCPCAIPDGVGKVRGAGFQNLQETCGSLRVISFFSYLEGEHFSCCWIGSNLA